MQEISAYLAELIGIYVLVLFGTMSVTILASILEFNSASLFSIVTFGMTVMIMIYSIGQVSGCRINPAVTISLLALRKIKIPEEVVERFSIYKSSNALSSYILKLREIGVKHIVFGYPQNISKETLRTLALSLPSRT